MQDNEPINVVVGAGSGMGAAAAEAIRGNRPLVVADANESGAKGVAAKLGGQVEAVMCDVTDESSCAALASRIRRLGALIVTAGLSPTMAAGERIFEVNLVGSARLLAVLDEAVTTGSAAVLFASMAGHGPTPDPGLAAVLDAPLAPDLPGRLSAVGVDPSDPGTAYSLSKLGVIRLARRSAASWWKRGARINSISPGVIDTPMGNQELAQQPMMSGMIDAVGRMGSAEELAAVAAFLVSDQASFVNGIDVLVDGGLAAM